jgi:hypothetical protein
MCAAVLSPIGGGSLLAIGAQWTIVIGVGACHGAGSIIMQVGDQRLVVEMAVMSRMSERRCRNHGSHCKNCRRPNKLDHCRSPKRYRPVSDSNHLIPIPTIGGLLHGRE